MMREQEKVFHEKKARIQLDARRKEKVMFQLFELENIEVLTLSSCEKKKEKVLVTFGPTQHGKGDFILAV